MKKIIIFSVLAFCTASAISQTDNIVHKKSVQQEQTKARSQAKKSRKNTSVNFEISSTSNALDIASLEKLYQEGITYYESREYDKAFPIFKKAAENSYPLAEDALGDCYYQGKGVTQSEEIGKSWYAKAFEGLRKMSEEGNLDAMYRYANDLSLGLICVKDEEKAVRLIQKSADLGFPYAQKTLGYMYSQGDGVPQSYEKAAEYYLKAAEAGLWEAQTNIADCYLFGQGVSQNYEEAAKWYYNAAEKGHYYPQNMIGLCYYKGLGLTKNYTKALEYFTKSADQGYVVAENNLGDCYFEEQNYTEAFSWFYKAANQGLAKAQKNVGDCYYHGRGVRQDQDVSMQWYLKAANQNNAEAQYMLGIIYLMNEAVEKKLKQYYVTAYEYFKLSAEQGYAPSQTWLGNCYKNGWGVKKDKKLAQMWYKKAAEQGNESAIKMLKK